MKLHESTAKNIPITLTNFFYWIGVYLFLPIIPIYYSNKGFSTETIGSIIGMFSVGAILTRFLVGIIADKLGYNKIAILGIIISLVAILGYPLTTNSTAIMGLRLLHGIGSAMYSAVALAIVTLYNKEEDVKDAVALYTLGSMLGIGLITGSALIIYTNYGYKISISLALLSTAIALMSFLKVPAVKSIAKSNKNMSIKKTITEPAVYLPTGGQFLVYVCYSLVITFLPLLSIKLHFEQELSKFYIAYSITVVLARFSVKSLNKKLSLNTLSKIILLLTTITIILMMVTPHFHAMLIVLGLVLGFTVGIATPVFVALITVNTAPQIRGSVMGLFSTSIDLGMVVGSLAVGLLLSHLSYNYIFIPICFLSIIYSVFYFYKIKFL